VIPSALNCLEIEGTFVLDESVGIASATPSLISFSENHLSNRIRQITGLGLTITNEQDKEIRFKLLEPSADKNENYAIKITQNAIELSGTQTGLFYAVESLCQLLIKKNKKWSWACLEIEDKPAFQWRGLMLDCSRHFINVNYILSYIDIISRMKMNRLHLHLNDDQGWRIEIKSHPELTNIGGYVKQGTNHEGFYTQEEIRRIIAFAKLRNVMIIPEIEIPGHAFAAMKSYPWLCCTGKPKTNQGHQKDLYCAGNEKTFEFLEDVFQEIIDLFPAPYIHIGGDEAPKENWEKCPNCQKRITEEQLKNEEELQAYMIQRIATFLQLQGKQVIGWDEILDGNPSNNLIVHWWRHRTHGNTAAIEALKKGHKLIASPNSFCYLNFPTEPEENFAIERTSTLKKIYESELFPSNLDSSSSELILGIECCLWTEYISEDEIDKMLFPRILALAELMWRYPENRDFDEFHKRVTQEEGLWKKANVEFGP